MSSECVGREPLARLSSSLGAGASLIDNFMAAISNRSEGAVYCGNALFAAAMASFALVYL
jgi:hypothetical protein